MEKVKLAKKEDQGMIALVWHQKPPDGGKPIPGYGDDYFIFRDGKIWSNGRKDYVGRYHPGRWMKGNISQSGYVNVTLCRYNEKRTYRVHRLVAEVFCENPYGYTQVNHIDGNKQNNHFFNLEWCSAQQNRKHAWDIGLSTVTDSLRISGKNLAKKFNHRRRRLTQNQVNEMRAIYNTGGISCKKLGLLFSLSESSTWDIVTYETYVFKPEEAKK